VTRTASRDGPTGPQRRHAHGRRSRLPCDLRSHSSSAMSTWLLIAALLLLIGGSAHPDAASPCPRMELIAHRGIAPVEGENTYTAFREAHRRGFRMIETDLRVTADGAFVIMHDPTLQRTAARPERVSELRLAHFRQLRTRGGDRVPTIEGVLRWARLNNKFFFLELKHDAATGWNSARLIRLLRIVDRYDMTDKVTYLSFHKSHLRAIERLDSSRRTAWIPRGSPTVPQAAGSVDKVVVSASIVNTALVRTLHRAGVQVSGRTTQRESTLDAFARAGVVEVITDELDPIAARKRPRTSYTCAAPTGGWR
jgi:glycerophosphoryl diester phosphodiesterase